MAGGRLAFSTTADATFYVHVLARYGKQKKKGLKRIRTKVRHCWRVDLLLAASGAAVACAAAGCLCCWLLVSRKGAAEFWLFVIFETGWTGIWLK